MLDFLILLICFFGLLILIGLLFTMLYGLFYKIVRSIQRKKHNQFKANWDECRKDT